MLGSQVQKTIGKHLMNLKATTKGTLADSKSIGGQCRLTEIRIKCIKKYYGLAIRQNTLKKPDPTETVLGFLTKPHHPKLEGLFHV